MVIMFEQSPNAANVLLLAEHILHLKKLLDKVHLSDIHDSKEYCQNAKTNARNAV